MIDDLLLVRYIRDQLPPGEAREIEEALRMQPGLRARLATLLEESPENETAPGTIWRESRLSCPTREQWGSYLLGVLDSSIVDYFRFHLEQVECPCCLANLEDLKELQHSSVQLRDRHDRIFRSSVGVMNLSSASLHASQKPLCK